MSAVIGNIETKSRVSKNKGTEDIINRSDEGDQVCKVYLKLYGNVRAASGKKKWLVSWDDGTTSTVSSSELTKEIENAGKEADEGDDDDGAEEDEEEDDGETGAGGSTCPHKIKREEADQKLKESFGEKVTVGESKTTTKVTWTVVDPNLLFKDHHPNLLGGGGERNASSPRPSAFTLFKSPLKSSPNELDVWLRLYPGDMEVHLSRMNTVGRNENSRFVPIDTREWVKFMGLFYGASLSKAKGRDFWKTEKPKSIFVHIPDFSQVMSRNRYESIKGLMKWAFADREKEGVDDWWRIRTGVDEYNKSRREVVNTSGKLVVDESMCPWQPRTTKTGDLPHLSFVERKPRPLGTEFKNSCDALTGILLHLEIQEGKNKQRQKQFTSGSNVGGIAGKLGVNSATCIRVVVNTLKEE
jgi:Transposase IS4